MADYRLVITNTGLTKLANANINGVQLKLTHYSVGDGVITPSLTTIGLVSEKYKAAINAVEIDNGVITIDCVVPSTVGGWYVRECGLWDGDDDLFAVCAVPPSYKVAPSEGAAKSLQIRLKIAINNAESIGFETDETVIYATQDWVLDRVSYKADKTIEITAGNGLAGGGDLSADRTLALANMAPKTVKGNKTDASAAPDDLTMAEIAAMFSDKSFPAAKIADITTDTAADNTAFTSESLSFPSFLQRLWRGITGLRGGGVTAGAGLTGGGSLGGDVSLSMGTPSDITGATVNEVIGATHTHKLILGGGWEGVSLSANTTYTNTSGRAALINIYDWFNYPGSGSRDLPWIKTWVNGILTVTTSGVLYNSQEAAVTFLVPAGATYSFSGWLHSVSAKRMYL
jgi:hypothetical protein